MRTWLLLVFLGLALQSQNTYGDDSEEMINQRTGHSISKRSIWSLIQTPWARASNGNETSSTTATSGVGSGLARLLSLGRSRRSDPGHLSSSISRKRRSHPGHSDRNMIRKRRSHPGHNDINLVRRSIDMLSIPVGEEDSKNQPGQEQVMQRKRRRSIEHFEKILQHPSEKLNTIFRTFPEFLHRQAPAGVSTLDGLPVKPMQNTILFLTHKGAYAGAPLAAKPPGVVSSEPVKVAGSAPAVAPNSAFASASASGAASASAVASAGVPGPAAASASPAVSPVQAVPVVAVASEVPVTASTSGIPLNSEAAPAEISLSSAPTTTSLPDSTLSPVSSTELLGLISESTTLEPASESTTQEPSEESSSSTEPTSAKSGTTELLSTTPEAVKTTGDGSTSPNSELSFSESSDAESSTTELSSSTKPNESARADSQDASISR